MAHTPEHLTLRISWEMPSLAETLETIIARAWAEGFRQGVNRERLGQGPFGSDEMQAQYRDWRGYGPGSTHPGGLTASTRIRAEDNAREVAEARDDRMREYLDASAACGDDEPTVCTAHMRFVPCRGRTGCDITSEPSAVETVSEYQQRLADYGS